MALSRVGVAAGDGTTITIPAGHQAGDLLLIYSFRSATTFPTEPAGWTAWAFNSSGASSFKLGYKVAGSSSETSGTWTNATGLICWVMRGQATNKTPLTAGVGTTGTGTTVTYPARSMSCPGTSWLIGFGAIKATTSTIETAPAGLFNQVDTVGAAVEYAGHDSNGAYTGTGAYPSTDVAVGTSAEWRSFVLEVLAEQMNLNNYQFVKVGDGMSVSEKIR